MTSRKPVALITGGARRLGAAISRGLAEAGYAVAIHTSSQDGQAEAFCRELNESGHRAKVFPADLLSEDATRALMPTLVEKMGVPEILVNNASIFEKDAPGGHRTIWDRHFDIHLRAPSVLIASLAEHMGNVEDALVVNMIDQRVLKPNPKFHSYTLSKSALWTATRTLALQYAPRIRVNAIGPGPSLPSPRQTQDAFDAQIAALPLKRGPSLEEFPQTVLFLAAMRSLTGQMITLDGGQHLTWRTDDLQIDE